ncbi:GrpE-domain-containing protein [Roridomyces roridus]|uniref:GrpE protein homolog, mitochondrial n=1 Tax=Roridomyces roridus TaxID=1738132 RepID=A0AAD7BWF7_9AGAR|nr:GrpE-domain-containing protein [Roridomyces roridus]
MSSALAATLRPCTTSLSYRSLARCSRLSFARRHYSDDKAPPSSEEPAQEPLKDAPPAEPSADPALAKAQAEAADLLGRLRYLQADFLNLQRNSAREREKTRDFAITNFAADLLETVDVLSMALKSVPESALSSPDPSDASSEAPAPESSPSQPPAKTAEEHLRELYTGVEITQRQLLQTLFKYHVKPFDPTGDQFDPNRHEALYQAPIPGKTPGTVIDCQKIGYTIRDRILRAAQVGVAQESQS